MLKRCRWAWLAAAVLVAGCRQADNPKAAPGPQEPGQAQTAQPADGGAADEGKAPAPAKSDPPARSGSTTAKGDSAGVPLMTLVSGPGDAGRPLPPAKGPVADNERCHVCHLNFSEERLAVSHALCDVGCEKCHGPSDDHCGDEGNVTAPSILYAKSDVDAACKKCHPEDKVVDNVTFCLYILNNPAPGKICTDCHGVHRMAQRTVHWDPKTGKLLVPAE